MHAQAPVKTAARMYNKLQDDHAQELVPRPAANVDAIRCTHACTYESMPLHVCIPTIRCGITAATPSGVVADLAKLQQLAPELTIARTKNGWRGGYEHDAARSARYHYAALLTNLVYRPHSTHIHVQY